MIRFAGGNRHMVNFTELNIDKLSPIYMQIIAFVKVGIVSGELQSGVEMPSRRMLSSLLGVNPNTIQKAYRMLEEEGLLISYLGSKSILSYEVEQWQRIKNELITEGTVRFLGMMKGMGLTKEATTTWVETLWEYEKPSYETGEGERNRWEN